MPTVAGRRPRRPSFARLFALFLLFVARGSAANFEQKGFVEAAGFAFPQLTVNDRAHFVGEALLRWEPTIRLGHSLIFFGGVDLRTDTHREVEREFATSWFDRTAQRQILTARRLSFLYRHKFLSVEVGKQFVRWGKTDILNPTDRFAPKDDLRVIDTDYLPVTAARVTLEHQSNTLDLVYVPRFTPARIPLLTQRWFTLPAIVQGFGVVDAGATFPGGPQFGVRFNRIARKLEYSLSFYQGFHYLPLLLPSFEPFARRIDLRRTYSKLRAFGGDAAIPLRWLTLKAETGMLTSPTRGQDEYLLYVIQLERQWKEWTFVGGYTGMVLTDRRGGIQFTADRGLTRAIVGRASVNLGSNRTLTFESVARQNANGLYVKAEHSQLVGQHWRWSAGFIGIRGDMSDFFGQYRRNSYASLALRYNF